MLKTIRRKIQSLPDAAQIITNWKEAGESIVWTNGCFDLLHSGHIIYLSKARALGDRLVIGLNSDHSVKLLKGSQRPIIDQDTRALKLAAMAFVDLVILFDEETPLNCIKKVLPSILVKGGDYQISTIVGADVVKNAGGKVLTIPFEEGHSSSSIIRKIQQLRDDH
jgi:rfaE bifunctional protein nucleotidyltransferase chain/domain